jgi:imidazolonepropionase-like amidohydrolase
MKMYKYLLLLVLGLLFPAQSGGAESSKITVIQSARMLDVTSGKIVENARVIIEGDRIKAIGAIKISREIQTIDLGNLTILPGLIDTHTHLSKDLDQEAFNRIVKEGPADYALRGARNARRTLLAGFTTVRDVGSHNFVDVSLKRAIDADLIQGPWIFPAGHALSITGGHCDVTGFAPGVRELGPEEGVADGKEALLRAVRYQIKQGAQVIKTCATAGVLSFEGPVGAQQFSEEELRVIVAEAQRHGLKVAAHAHGTEGILAAVRAGVASIEHGSILNDEAIHLMKDRGTYLVPTTYLAGALNMDVLPPPIRAKAEHLLPIAKESLRRAIQAGVPIAFGTDAGVYPHGDNAKEFAALVEAGMTPLETIRAATLNAADLLGVTDRGVIAPGRLADLVAVPGNPLTDVKVLENVKFVMRGGKIVKQP